MQYRNLNTQRSRKPNYQPLHICLSEQTSLDHLDNNLGNEQNIEVIYGAFYTFFMELYKIMCGKRSSRADYIQIKTINRHNKLNVLGQKAARRVPNTLQVLYGAFLLTLTVECSGQQTFWNSNRGRGLQMSSAQEWKKDEEKPQHQNSGVAHRRGRKGLLSYKFWETAHEGDL